jgi:hypothetical protein
MANSKYTHQQVIDLLDSDEPTFILRAKDMLSVSLLKKYQLLLLDTAVLSTANSANDMNGVIKQFDDWRKANLDKIQYPTL